jgi:hypothetical protein
VAAAQVAITRSLEGLMTSVVPAPRDGSHWPSMYSFAFIWPLEVFQAMSVREAAKAS